MEQSKSRNEQALSSKELSSDFAAIGKQRFDDFVSVQGELLEQIRQINELWLDRLRSEANLASEFASKLTAARSLPEAMSASHEWTTRRLQMMTEDSKRLLAVIQKFAETSSQLIAPHDLVMRILKLRWIGMEGEAEKVEAALHRLDPQTTLVRGPGDTD